MSVVNLTEFLVKSVSKKPDMISVKKIEDDDNFIIQVMVPSDEIATIIGKNGVIASSIRNIVNLAAYNEGLSNVKVYLYYLYYNIL